LEVLMLSHNEISTLGSSLAGLSSLKALVVDHNCLKRVSGLDNLKRLETLVASNNEIEEFEEPKKALGRLKKISLSHNRIRKFPFSVKLFAVEELRLSHNRLQEIPESIKFMGKLRILEIGHNSITSRAGLEPCFNLLQLTTLNTHGNPYDTTSDEVKELITTNIPRLKVLNSRPLCPKPPKKRRKS